MEFFSKQNKTKSIERVNFSKQNKAKYMKIVIFSEQNKTSGTPSMLNSK